MSRVVAAYEHHINRTMSTERKAAMKYPACSSCKNEPYQAGVGGPCATCGVLVETSTGREAGTPANWYPKLDAEFAKAQAPIERALATQVGGSHYKDMPIQPAEYCHKNRIGKLEGDVIAYVSRWRKKSGIEDLKKARHTIDIIIELEGGAS